jgi:hypothetical protein
MFKLETKNQSECEGKTIPLKLSLYKDLSSKEDQQEQLELVIETKPFGKVPKLEKPD